MKTDNIRAAVATRAAQIARDALKTKFLGDGGKLRDFSLHDFASAITALANDPTILAKATADVERWRKNRVPKR